MTLEQARAIFAQLLNAATALAIASKLANDAGQVTLADDLDARHAATMEDVNFVNAVITHRESKGAR